LSASILAGSLIGPFIAGFIGLSAALVAAAVVRMAAGVAIFKGGYGRRGIQAISSTR